MGQQVSQALGHLGTPWDICFASWDTSLASSRQGGGLGAAPPAVTNHAHYRLSHLFHCSVHLGAVSRHKEKPSLILGSHPGEAPVASKARFYHQPSVPCYIGANDGVLRAKRYQRFAVCTFSSSRRLSYTYLMFDDSQMAHAGVFLGDH